MSTSLDMCRPLGECPPYRDGPRRAKEVYTFAEAIAAVDYPNPRRHQRITASSDYSNSSYDMASTPPSKFVSPIKRPVTQQLQQTQKTHPRDLRVAMMQRERNFSVESNTSSLTMSGGSRVAFRPSFASTHSAKLKSRLVLGYSGNTATERQKYKSGVFNRSLAMFGGVEARSPFVGRRSYCPGLCFLAQTG